MAKTATVKLYDPKRNRTIKVDAFHYATNTSAYQAKGYTRVIGESRGEDAAAQATSNKETKINDARKRSPEREKKFRDKERAYKERAVEVTTAETKKIDPEWDKIPWFKRRVYVHEVTGTTPKTAAEAKELMSPYE
jgi:hypothetical protein